MSSRLAEALVPTAGLAHAPRTSGGPQETQRTGGESRALSHDQGRQAERRSPSPANEGAGHTHVGDHLVFREKPSSELPFDAKLALKGYPLLDGPALGSVVAEGQSASTVLGPVHRTENRGAGKDLGSLPGRW